jgi:UDP-2,3-diacylglucosamine pyrophosphatase LpxH
MATKLEKYQRQIARGLDRAFREPSHRLSMELASLRLVLFSDLHRGARDGADDFQRCERAYNAALAYYFRAGYTLCLLGDVEELWECRPSTVLQKYQHSFELERKYLREGRYWRIWGNHDDLWSFPNAARKYLGAVGLDGPIWESLRLELLDQGTRLGELFIIHGHQGTTSSDRFGQVSRLFVRYVWRNWQRLTKMASTTPARNWELRQKHDEAMYRWALSQRDPGLILFAGHTHRPVFRAESLVDRLTRELKELEHRSDGPELLEHRRDLEAELEWVRASQFQTPKVISMEAPCYFNTGCCSFGDGDVTGLEISDGKIQLVRWPDNADRPRPQVLTEEPADLRQCFEEIRGSRRVQPTPPPEGAALH